MSEVRTLDLFTTFPNLDLYLSSYNTWSTTSLSPIPVKCLNKIIGWAHINPDISTLRAAVFMDYNSPERLAIETEKEHYRLVPQFTLKPGIRGVSVSISDLMLVRVNPEVGVLDGKLFINEP